MRTLIVFAREPLPGRTKTRLCPPLVGDTAAALYECFLRDILDSVRQLPAIQPAVAYTPETAGPFFAAIAPDIPARPQRGDSLGERLDNAFRDTFGQTNDQRPTTTAANSESLVVGPSPFVFGPSSSVVIIGSDSPDLPTAYLREAFVRLEAGAEVVLGPSDDGGYYLIGLRVPQPRLLREVPMSTPTVLTDTLALARELGLRVALLPSWYDVDTAAELRRIAETLREAPPDTAPRTRAFLEQHPGCGGFPAPA